MSKSLNSAQDKRKLSYKIVLGFCPDMAFSYFGLWSDKNHLQGSIKMSDKFQMTFSDSFEKLTGNYTSELTLDH